MKKGLTPVLLLIIFGFSIQCHADQRCKGLPDHTRLKADKCSNYIECEGEKDLERTCPDGYGFDGTTKSCSWYNEVCENKVRSKNHCKYVGEVLPDPSSTDCNRFQYCKRKVGNGQIEAELVECPPGEIFNPTGFSTYHGSLENMPCSVESEYLCPMKATMPDCRKIKSGTYIPDPTNCFGYYYCYHGIRLKGQCDESIKHFDVRTKSCVNKTEHFCKEICKGKTKARVGDSEICTAYYYCETGNMPVQYFCPPGYYYNTVYGNCYERRYPNCTCEQYGIFPDFYVQHEDTNKFWECGKGTRTLRTCFEGSTYDPISASCVISDVGIFQLADE